MAESVTEIKMIVVVAVEPPDDLAGRPPALWAVGGQTVIGHLIEQVAGQGVARAIIGCEGTWRQAVEAKVNGITGITVDYITDGMPRGRGGILKDAAKDGDEIVVLMHANMVWVPDLGGLVAEHAASGADLSVVRGSDADVAGLGRDGNQIFIAGRSVLDCIPAVGYCDVKEGLIPTLVKAGLKVRQIAAPQGWGCFGTWREYLEEVFQWLGVSGKLLAQNSIHRDGQDVQDGGGSRRVDEESGSQVAEGGERSSRGAKTQRLGVSGKLLAQKSIHRDGQDVQDGGGSRRVDEESGSQVAEEQRLAVSDKLLAGKSIHRDGQDVQDTNLATEGTENASPVLGNASNTCGSECRRASRSLASSAHRHPDPATSSRAKHQQQPLAVSDKLLAGDAGKQRLAVSDKRLAGSSGVVEERSSGVGARHAVHETARVVGAVWIGRGAQIEEGAVVIGPVVIGAGCRIGRGAVVSESVLWEGSVIEGGAAVVECLVDAGAVVGAGAEIRGEWCRGVAVRGDCVTHGQDAHATHGQDAHATLRARTAVKCRAASLEQNAARRGRDVETVLSKTLQEASARLNAASEDRVPAKAWWWAGAAAVAACFLWSYWNPTIVSLWGLWMRSDEFSSGLLVPFLAVYVLWCRRQKLAGVAIRPAVFWGIAAFAAAQAMRFVGLWLMYGSAENLSLVLTLCALVLLLFGWKVVWRVWPVLAFLFLMLPFPHRVQAWITVPLQRWATSSAVFGLEMLGFEVGRHGNVIDLNGTMVAVAEACNGLRMLTAFVVIAALVALVVERRWWEKAILVASSVPIAFACNTLRLVITAIAFTQLNTEAWEERFHDFGGLAMMPVALGMILGLLWLLGQVVVREDQIGTEPVSTDRLVVRRQSR